MIRATMVAGSEAQRERVNSMTDEKTPESTAIECPVCGSKEIETSSRVRQYTPPFGKDVSFAVTVNTCLGCGEDGDFARINEESVKKAVQAADQQSLQVMLDWLSEADISMAYMERALGLPARTVARWKAGVCSASGIALMRVVRAYPWILEVAAAHFTEPAANRAVLAAAGSVIARAPFGRLQ
jgi:hypothetical protein